MTLSLTPDILVATYELLLTTPPFRSWKLPPSDEIEFHITRSVKHFGTCDGKSITISDRKHGTLSNLLVTVAHEMVHLREFQTGARSDIQHGAEFNKLADRVCRIHNFDRSAF